MNLYKNTNIQRVCKFALAATAFFMGVAPMVAQDEVDTLPLAVSTLGGFPGECLHLAYRLVVGLGHRLAGLRSYDDILGHSRGRCCFDIVQSEYYRSSISDCCTAGWLRAS